jgi:hypothetical protein
MPLKSDAAFRPTRDYINHCYTALVGGIEFEPVIRRLWASYSRENERPFWKIPASPSLEVGVGSRIMNQRGITPQRGLREQGLSGRPG